MSLLTTFSETTTGRDGSSEAAPRALCGSPSPRRSAARSLAEPYVPPEASKSALSSGRSAA